MSGVNMENKNMPHDCGEPLFEIEGIPVLKLRRFKCPKCSRVLRVKEIIQIITEWEDEHGV